MRTAPTLKTLRSMGSYRSYSYRNALRQMQV